MAWPLPEEWRVGRGQLGTAQWLSQIPTLGRRVKAPKENGRCLVRPCAQAAALWGKKVRVCGTQALLELDPTERTSSSVSWAAQPGLGRLHLFSVVRCEEGTTTGP